MIQVARGNISRIKVSEFLVFSPAANGLDSHAGVCPARLLKAGLTLTSGLTVVCLELGCVCGSMHVTSLSFKV